MKQLPYNRPFTTGREFEYIREAIAAGHLSGNGPFARRCEGWLAARVGSARALLTHSCTGALEMAAILAHIAPGDEIIMPSFTFVSTANAFVLRGGVPVFVDVREDTLNIDEQLIERAITPRTKAVALVHYAGISCELDPILELAGEHGLLVIEDAAQALLCNYRGRPLGSFGQLSAVSFHETKNVISGEGGALLVNDERYVDRAEIIHEKGTNRRSFVRGTVDKYTWVDIGSSFLLSEVNAAFLWAQMEEAERITEARLAVWRRYHERLAEYEHVGLLRRPVCPPEAEHNGHLYYVLVRTPEMRATALEWLTTRGVSAVFHYVPLHSSPAGLRYGRASGRLPVTEDVAERLIRLPLWVGMDDSHVDRVVDTLAEGLAGGARPESVAR
jgi:dTDP-4-amino-4,6-dideoxygalactose transaminase